MGLVDNAVRVMLGGQENLVFDPESSILLFPECESLLIDLGSGGQEILGEGDDNILGMYEPMASPGRITLFGSNLRRFFWYIVYRLGRQGAPVLREDLQPMAQLVALGTYHHEYFHFFTDIQQRLFPGFQYDKLVEEALATAYSRQKVEAQRSVWQSKVGRLPGFIYYQLLKERFSYTAKGYRDWPNYSPWDAFLDGLVNYINPPQTQFLRSSGVDLEGMFQAQLERVYLCRVVEVLG
jgi:hypothetical protein